MKKFVVNCTISELAEFCNETSCRHCPLSDFCKCMEEHGTLVEAYDLIAEKEIDI